MNLNHAMCEAKGGEWGGGKKTERNYREIRSAI